MQRGYLVGYWRTLRATGVFGSFLTTRMTLRMRRVAAWPEWVISTPALGIEQKAAFTAAKVRMGSLLT